MFGKNPIARPELDSDGLQLRVVEGSPFYTVQGEGPYAGYAAVFLRLHGCNLRCWFCDTEFSNPDDGYLMVEDIITRAENLVRGAPVFPLMVITGGEPARQNLEPLIRRLFSIGWKVQIETAGTLWQDVFDHPEIMLVVSPKTAKIHPKVWRRADAFKYVVRAEDEGVQDDGLPVQSMQRPGEEEIICRPRAGALVYVSPMDEGDETKNRENRRRVGQLAMNQGYIAMLQMHKFLDLP